MSFNISKILIYGTAVLGFAMFLVGAIIYCGVIPMKVQREIVAQLTIETNSSAYDRFVKMPISLKWSMYFFNITNPEAFDNSKNHSDLRVLKYTEMGPYVYDEMREKIQVEFGDDDHIVRYVEQMTYQFNEKLSEGLSSDDSLSLVDLFFASPSGYAGGNISSNYLTVNDIASIIQSGTNYANASIKTGKENIKQVGQFLEYRGFHGKIDKIWNASRGAKCEKLDGTDGTHFRPQLRSTTDLYTFSPNLCKSIKFVNNEKEMPSETVQGINTMRFYPSKDNFDNSTENDCACLEDSLEDCPADLLNLRTCPVSNGMNMLASSPYFLNNPSLLDKSSIKAPNPLSLENYGTTLDVEPTTGLVLRVRKRLQLNVQLRRELYPNKEDFLHNLTDRLSFVPLVWIEESGEVDEEDAHKLKEVLNRMATVRYLMIGLMVAGAAVLVTSGVCAFLKL